MEEKNNIDYCDRTGLLYVNGVPLTKEPLIAILSLSKAYDCSKQFSWSVSITDHIEGDFTVDIDNDLLIKILSYIDEHNLSIASIDDF